MTSLLLDASVWVATIDPDDERGAAARSLMRHAVTRKQPIFALDLTLYELANVATTRMRSTAQAKQLVHTVAATTSALQRVDAELLEVAASIADEHGISVYDAAYVAAARRNGWRLVSLDEADLVVTGLAEPPDALAG